MPASFNAVTIAPEPGTASAGLAESAGVIEVEFADGGRLRMSGPVDAATVKALLAALSKARRGRRGDANGDSLLGLTPDQEDIVMEEATELSPGCGSLFAEILSQCAGEPATSSRCESDMVTE